MSRTINLFAFDNQQTSTSDCILQACFGSFQHFLQSEPRTLRTAHPIFHGPLAALRIINPKATGRKALNAIIAECQLKSIAAGHGGQHIHSHLSHCWQLSKTSIQLQCCRRSSGQLFVKLQGHLIPHTINQKQSGNFRLHRCPDNLVEQSSLLQLTSWQEAVLLTDCVEVTSPSIGPGTPLMTECPDHFFQ